MGNSHSVDIIPPRDGDSFFVEEQEEAFFTFLLAQEGILMEEIMAMSNEPSVAPPAPGPPGKRFRNVYERPDYSQSVWWLMLEKGNCKVPGHREHTLFRRRFGVGFLRFKEFCESARGWDITKETDAVGRLCVPLELKVLGALRMVCKGCAFDAIAELSGMSEQTMHRFFHSFWAKFVIQFKDMWIKYPKTFAEASESMAMYAKLGYPGGAGSVDVTHVWWANCPAGLASIYTGKEKIPTVAYEVTVDHTCRCMHVSEGHPGSRTDKTIVKTDEFLQAIRRKEILWDDVLFELYRADGTKFLVRGAYLISDNGYAKWRMLQAPIKSSSSLDELKWSTRLESVRKDVECFFGRLKIRFRILRSRILFHKQKCVDNVFVAACIMHNMLLHDDGLQAHWGEEQEEQSDDDDLRQGIEMRRIRLRLVRTGEAGAVQSVPEVIRQIAMEGEVDNDIEDSHFTLRTQLIAHYKYCKEHNLIHWMVRNGVET
jgi:hypothetical protein